MQMPIRDPAEVNVGAFPLDETIGIVITTYNDATYLREALSSVFAQNRLPAEVIVVDDGSAVSPAPIVSEFPLATLLRKPNGGLSSARNVGFHGLSSRYVMFLDADDRLAPNAISAGIGCFALNPAAAMVYGGHRRIDADGRVIVSGIYRQIGPDPYANLLAGNLIGMHATVLYRRDVLSALGGFDETLHRCEDYDLYLRLARNHSIVSHPKVVADYRWHGRNMSKDAEEMLAAALLVHSRHRGHTAEQRRAWRSGRRSWKAWYGGGQQADWDGQAVLMPSWTRFSQQLSGLVRRLKPTFGKGRLWALYHKLRGTWPPPVGLVSFGRFASSVPISRDFGWERGTPVDRFYIERFLASNAGVISGHVLEVGDDAYSKRFGGHKIKKQDVLHVHPHHPDSTLFGDLTKSGVLPSATFDCVVLTQTLQLIFNLEQAVERLHDALKPGGVLLLTVPGISPIDRGEWADTWYWAFTPASVLQLFQGKFGTNLKIETHGNIFAAMVFLQGVALEEVDQNLLETYDPAYPVTITLRAEKS